MVARAAQRPAILLAALLFALCVAIGAAIAFGVGVKADEAALRAIALRDGKVPDLLIDGAQFASWIGDSAQRALFILAFCGWLAWQRRFRAALIMAVVPVVAGATSSILKQAFARARPDVVPHLDHVSNLSYPSGHATTPLALFLLAALLLPGRQPQLRIALALGAGFLIGASRLALGVHYPADVIGGWALGASFAIIGAVLARQWAGRSH